MASKTNYLEDAVMNVLRGTTLTGVTAYIGLFTAAPGETGGGTEVTGNGYARKSITFGAPSAGTMTNSAAVNFDTPTPAGWGTIVGWGIFDALTTGNMLYYGDQTPNKTINANDTVSYAIGAISISED